MKLSGFKQILQFFDSKPSNKIFTRAEYFMVMKPFKMKDSYKDCIRCYLVRAGYLHDFEPGVYRKLKKIPQDLTLNRLLDEAYPHSIEDRKKGRRRADYGLIPYGVKPYVRKRVKAYHGELK